MPTHLATSLLATIRIRDPGVRLLLSKAPNQVARQKCPLLRAPATLAIHHTPLGLPFVQSHAYRGEVESEYAQDPSVR